MEEKQISYSEQQLIQSTETPKTYSYGKRPLWQWILLYIVIGGLIYAGIYYFFFKKEGYNYSNNQYQQTTDQSNTNVTIPSPNNFFVPNRKPAGSVTPSQAGITPQKINIPITTNSLKQFVSESKANVAIGIRKENKSLSKRYFQFVDSAYADSTLIYPVIYYIDAVDFKSSYKEITAINVLTGEKKIAVTDDKEIRSVGFNQKYQLISYTVTSEKTYGTDKYPYADIVIYDLNKGTKETVLTGVMWNQIKWSPDEESFAYATNASSSTIQWHIYAIQTKKTVDLDVALQGNIRWTDDSKGFIDESHIGGKVDYHNSTFNYDTYYNYYDTYKYLLNDNTSTLLYKNSSKNIKISIPLLVNNKLFYKTRNPLEADSYNSYNGTPAVNKTVCSFTEFNWLHYADITSGTDKDFRKETGDFLYEFMVDSTGNYVVFSEGVQTDNGGCSLELKYLNITTGVVTDLPKPDGTLRYTLLGWNGNEKNIAVWTETNYFYNINLDTKGITKIAQ